MTEENQTLLGQLTRAEKAAAEQAGQDLAKKRLDYVRYSSSQK